MVVETPIECVNKNFVDPNDYKILFRLKDKSNFLINSFLLQGPLKFADPLIINRCGFWTFYLNKKDIAKLERRGYNLFKNDHSFKKYSKSFYSYIYKMDQEIIPRYKDIEGVNKEELEHFIRDLSKLWYFYGFTESVYSDFTCKRMIKMKDKKLKETIKNNLNVLISLKEKGRKVFNECVMKGGIINRVLSEIENSSEDLLEEGDSSYLTIRELGVFLKNNGINKKIIKERKKAYVLGLFKGKLKIFNFNDSSEVAGRFFNSEKIRHKKSEKEISGVIANRGIARGRVIISPMLDIEESKRISKRMETGDILVAQSTNPNLIFLCEKAGAIVTDQGGILSHAAIISREMGKPCVVGTVFATKILEDGDFIEVDANKGVIKVIEKIK